MAAFLSMVNPAFTTLITSDASLDTTVVDTLVSIITKVLGLFSVFPLNIFLTAGFVGLAIGIFKSLKH